MLIRKLFGGYHNEAGDGTGMGSSAGGGDNSGTGNTTTDTGAGTAVDWRTGIDKDILAAPSMADIKDINGLAKSYVHAQALVGSKLNLPTAESTQEEWNSFYGKVGRPESADGYQLQSPPGMPIPDTELAFVKGLMHKHGLSKNQAEGIFAEYIGREAETFNTQQQNAQAEIQTANMKAKETLHKLWPGTEFDLKMNQANLALKSFINPELKELLDNSNLGNHPGMVQIFAEIGKMIGEDKAIQGAMQSNGFTPSVEDAKAQIAAKMADKEFMKTYTTQNAIGHQEAKNVMNRLYATAYPGRQ